MTFVKAMAFLLAVAGVWFLFHLGVQALAPATGESNGWRQEGAGCRPGVSAGGYAGIICEEGQ